jgi:hypothetical protein
MNNPWKLATIGLALTGVTAIATGLTTAYMVRSPSPSQAEMPPSPPTLARYAPAPAVPAPRVTRAAVATTVPARPTPPRVVPVSTPAPVAADCDTGGDRALRIAKPGALGALLGAGLGAASGAIANGGKAAGRGALIGGLAGAAVGTGYGAYKTHNECGTIIGNAFTRRDTATARAEAPQSALIPASADDQIQVYRTR